MSPEFYCYYSVNGGRLYRKSPPGANKEKQAAYDLPVKCVITQSIKNLCFPSFPSHIDGSDLSARLLYSVDSWIQADAVDPRVFTERGASSL